MGQEVRPGKKKSRKKEVTIKVNKREGTTTGLTLYLPHKYDHYFINVDDYSLKVDF